MGYSTPIFVLLVGNFYSNAMDHKINSRKKFHNEITIANNFTVAHNLENQGFKQDFSTTREIVSQPRGRLPFMLPVMYNLGVITTLLVVLTVLMFKGLTLGVIILILNLNGKGHKQNSPARPVHIHVHSGSKQPYYIPELNRMDEDELNSTQRIYTDLFHPRGFYNKYSS